MNQNLPGDPLDQLLNQWADERSVSSEHLDNLQERIVVAIGDEEPASTGFVGDVLSEDLVSSSLNQVASDPTFRSQSVDTRRASVAGFLVGVTLTVLVGFVWFAQLMDYGRQEQRQHADGDPSTTPDYAWLDDDHLHSRTVLLSEMKELFGNRLEWLAETDARIEVGLSERLDINDGSMFEDNAVQLAVRVVVEKRSSADNAWQRAWAVDVMSRSEEVVELAPASGDGTSMTLWAYALPDGMVAVDSELVYSNNKASTPTLSSSAANAFRAAFSHVQRDRLPSEELLTGSDGVEYRVFQTVAVLNKKVG